MVCSEPERLPCLRGILRCTEKVCQPHSLLRLPLKEGFFYSSPSRSSFLNEPIYSFILIWSPQCLPVIDPLYTFESLFCSSPPYLCSKVFDFHSDISYLRVDQKSSEKSPPLKYPTRLEALIFGGMLSNMCIWSGNKFASMISVPSLSTQLS